MPAIQLDLEKAVTSSGDLTVIHAKGKLSLETVNQFVNALRPEPSQCLVLDMSRVTFLDSAGLGALVLLFVNRRGRGKAFALAALAPQATAVLAVAGLQKLLPVYQSVEEATAHSH